MSGHPLQELVPSVRFPVTICVLCYGPHTDLAERFLDRLYRHTDPALFQLRAGLNEVAPETLGLFLQYAERYGNIAIYLEAVNVFKNPLMRRMFTGPSLPGNWVIWFDDDSYVTRPDWLARLSMKMEHHPEVAQWGKIYTLRRHDREMEEFIKTAGWYRGIPLNRTGPDDGREEWEFRFATGGFWALKRSVIEKLDWPDPRLKLANEDFLLGEALRQHGFLIGWFSSGVEVNAASRRNESAREIHHLG